MITRVRVKLEGQWLPMNMFQRVGTIRCIDLVHVHCPSGFIPWHASASLDLENDSLAFSAGSGRNGGRPYVNQRTDVLVPVLDGIR